jgi:hypothetical protein
MSFLYPRTISISRENTDETVGAQPYSGLAETNETVIASGIAAHIQAEKGGASPKAMLPADAARESLWRIIFKAANGLVQDRDFITDDQGNRYQVISAYWNPMVTSCIAQIMET